MTDTNKEIRGRRIIERLKMFNRKERDHLMKFALCKKPEAPELSPEFWKFVSGDNGTEHPSASKLFVGMDYHLNWIYAALASSEIEDLDSFADMKNKWKCRGPSDKNDKDFRPIQENQQDVDLLVAWADARWRKPLRFVLIEAKLDSGWVPDQLASKRKRLELIREDAILRGLDFIDWRFLLLSPPSEATSDSERSDDFYDWFEWNESQGERRQVKRVSGSFDKWEIV